MAPENPSHRARLRKAQRDLDAAKRYAYYDPDMETCGVASENGIRAIRMKLDRINKSIRSLQITIGIGVISIGIGILSLILIIQKINKG